MQSKKRCLLALGLLTCLMDVGATAGEKGQDFISKDQSAAWAQASSATISDIGWMRRTPKMIDQTDRERSSKPLSPQDTAALRQWIAQIRRFDKAPEPSQCHFAPGFQIRFLNGKSETLETLLLCLNCNVLAVGDTPDNASGSTNRYRIDMVPARYGDALGHRAELLALVAKYFPKP